MSYAQIFSEQRLNKLPAKNLHNVRIDINKYQITHISCPDGLSRFERLRQEPEYADNLTKNLWKHQKYYEKRQKIKNLWGLIPKVRTTSRDAKPPFNKVVKDCNIVLLNGPNSRIRQTLGLVLGLVTFGADKSPDC